MEVNGVGRQKTKRKTRKCCTVIDRRGRKTDSWRTTSRIIRKLRGGGQRRTKEVMQKGK